MKKIGYLRVSTLEQRPDRQVEGLTAICDELHIERLSATSRSRPVYEAVVQRLQPGDTLVVWDLDRAFRSTADVLSEAEKFRSRGIRFRLANLDILDTDSPAGIFVVTMLGALAEFERRTLSDRTKEGLAAAKLRGKRLGRPPKLDETKLAAARAMLSAPAPSTLASIASRFDVAPWTLSRALRRQERVRDQRAINGRKFDDL